MKTAAYIGLVFALSYVAFAIIAWDPTWISKETTDHFFARAIWVMVVVFGTWGVIARPQF